MARYLSRLRGEARSAGQREQRRGQMAEDEYYGRATGFDPYEAVSTAAGGAWGMLEPELQRTIDRRRAGAVGRGRLNTGFQDIDEREILRGGRDYLSNVIASNAMNAASLDLNNIQGIGGYGERKTGNYLDLGAAELDRAQADENARQQRKAQKWSLLGKFAGGAAGTLLGPAGSAIGSWLGDKLGGAVT